MSSSRNRLGGVLRVLMGVALALLARLVRALTRTRVRQNGPRGPEAAIFAFKHGDQLALLGYPLTRPTAAIVSRSADGELQSHVLSSLGLHIIRGSSSAGGATALASCLRWLAAGNDLALAVDGPRGPAGRCKPGVVWISQKARAPIVAVACRSSRALRLARSWDRFSIPLPLARVHIVSASPFRPWEKDWTEHDKLKYLDSLLEQTEDVARRELEHEGESHERSGEHRRQDR